MVAARARKINKLGPIYNGDLIPCLFYDDLFIFYDFFWRQSRYDEILDDDLSIPDDTSKIDNPSTIEHHTE